MTNLQVVPTHEIDFISRSIVLDEQLMSSINVQAQKVEVALVKRLRIDAPWMLPKLILQD